MYVRVSLVYGIPFIIFIIPLSVRYLYYWGGYARPSKSRELIAAYTMGEHNGGAGGTVEKRGVDLIPLIPANFSGDASRCYF